MLVLEMCGYSGDHNFIHLAAVSLPPTPSRIEPERWLSNVVVRLCGLAVPQPARRSLCEGGSLSAAACPPLAGRREGGPVSVAGTKAVPFLPPDFSVFLRALRVSVANSFVV